MTRSAVLIAAALVLGGCGNIGDLEPPPGKPLPVKPLMARSVPTPEDLLTRPAYASPNRVDELMRRSTARTNDRFDLPPPSGGAPSAPVEAEADEEDVNAKGPVKPQ
jgi:hypothetical protein